jgi:tyrosyl-tRNA synthetase
VHRVEGRSLHAFSTPLVTKADGTKFGKTESGTVWLDPELTTPYAFYQFWVNAEDRDIGGWLRVFSFRSREEIEALEAALTERPAAREAQRALAEELTTLVHGAEECARVVAASKALFGQGALEALDERTLAAALAAVPSVRITGALPSVTELLAVAGVVESKSAARRVVREGGAYVNNTKVIEADEPPGAEALLHGRWLVLRRGEADPRGCRRDPRHLRLRRVAEPARGAAPPGPAAVRAGGGRVAGRVRSRFDSRNGPA